MSVCTYPDPECGCEGCVRQRNRRAHDQTEDAVTIVLACSGGWAHGASFEGHALEGIPATIRVVTGPDGIALLDLSGDEPEKGETLHVYSFSSVGMLCTRGRRGCVRVATYIPARPGGEDEAFRASAAEIGADVDQFDGAGHRERRRGEPVVPFVRKEQLHLFR